MGTFNMKFLILTVAFMLVQLSQQAALGEMYEDGDVQSQERTEFTVDDSGNSNPPPGGRPSGRNLEEGQEPQEDPSERNQEVQEEVEPQEDPSERNQEVQEEVEPQDGDVQSQERTEFTVDDSGNSNPPPGGRPSGRNPEEGQEPQEDPSERNKE